MHLIRSILIGTCVCAAAASAAEPAHHTETVQSARVLLQTATYADQQGGHIMLLRALRQLRDTKLRPLFEHVSKSDYPSLRLHGTLALAEIAEQPGLRAEHLAIVRKPALQWAMVRHALTVGLMETRQAKQLLELDTVPLRTRILLATSLPIDSEIDLPAIRAAMDDPDPITAALAAMVLAQRGDELALEPLRQLNQTRQAHRNSTRSILIGLALENQQARLGPWILEVAKDAKAPDELTIQALKAATLLGSPGAAEQWHSRFDSASTTADRLRLSMHAMEVAHRLDPAFFETLMADGMPTIRLCGQIGLRISQKRDASDSIRQLLQQNSPLAARWALSYAKTAPLEQMRTIAQQLILAAEKAPNPPLFRAQRLSAAIKAAMIWAQRDPTAQRILQPMIHSVPSRSRQAILMGLLNANLKSPLPFKTPSAPTDRTTEAMATLLNAKGAQALDNNSLERLGLVSRGTGRLDAPLRLQAAWIYLTNTDERTAVIDQVLREIQQP
jgi:hypothetical protein